MCEKKCPTTFQLYIYLSSLHPIVERESWVATGPQHLRQPVLEATPVLDEVRDVASGQGVVQDSDEDVIKEGEEEALDQVPDHGGQQVEQVVDGLSKVVTTHQVIKVHLNVGEVCTEFHVCDLNRLRSESVFRIKFTSAKPSALMSTAARACRSSP